MIPLLSLARGDMARARRANDNIHMIAGIKGGGTVDIRYVGKNHYQIVKLGDMTGAGSLLHDGDGLTTAAFIVDEIYDLEFVD